MVLRSEQYDDVYFSAQDGLAETRHVFLEGNNLPAAWANCAREFVIAETGFGTGLNFLAVWALFEETAPSEAQLHFISVEKFPLSGSVIAAELERWGADLAPYLNQFLKAYREEIQTTHKIQLTDRVALTLLIGDVNDVLEGIHFTADCWFLDGFSPANNPDMWNVDVFAQVARLTRDAGTFSTFTAAGFVRRGLMDAGFEVTKKAGYGRKREMCTGVKKCE